MYLTEEVYLNSKEFPNFDLDQEVLIYGTNPYGEVISGGSPIDYYRKTDFSNPFAYENTVYDMKLTLDDRLSFS